MDILIPKKEKSAEETIFLPSSMKEIKVLPIGFFSFHKWTIIINFYSVELSFNTVGDFDLFVFFVTYGTYGTKARNSTSYRVLVKI